MHEFIAWYADMTHQSKFANFEFTSNTKFTSNFADFIGQNKLLFSGFYYLNTNSLMNLLRKSHYLDEFINLLTQTLGHINN